MTNIGDKILGLVLGVFISALICGMLIFKVDNVSWFELVKTLSTLLVAGAFVIAVLSYVRQSNWRRQEDQIEDSKIFCEAATEGLEKCSELLLKSFKGEKWHIATVHLEEVSIVARNISSQSVRDVFNLKKSVIFTNVLSHVYSASEFQFSGLVDEEYQRIKSKVRELSSTNISSMNEAQVVPLRNEMIEFADLFRDGNAIDFSSIIEVCISCSLFEHEDIFDKEMINRAYDGISPDYLDVNVIEKALSFIEDNFKSSSLSYYVKFLNEFSDVLLSLGVDKKIQLIGN
jgi:hypothetical protein